MIFLKLAIWLIAPLFNAWMDRKGAKRNYLIVNILRGMALILHGSLFIDTYEGYWYYWWPVLVYEFTSFWIVFEIALNLWQKKPLLYYDTKEHDSGWTDKFFAWAGTGWHTAAKLAALVGNDRRHPLILQRVYLPTETLGSMYWPSGDIICKTMELPWLENKRSISCIPEGEHRVIYQPPKPGRPYEYFRLPDVEGRSGILIHRITFVKDLKGCIGVGGRFTDINNDGVPDIEESSKKLKWMVDNLPREFTLIITKKP